MPTEKKTTNYPIILFIIITCFILGIWLLCANLAIENLTKHSLGAASYSLLLANSIDKLGQLGDLFGSINALFSGIALAGVAVSLYIQRKELSLTRKEMEKQCEAMEAQKQALEDQKKVWEQQGFDSAFYSLFTTHNNIKNSLTTQIDGITYSGQAVFAKFSLTCFEEIDQNQNKPNPLENKIHLLLYDRYSFSAYMSSLDQLFKLIDYLPTSSLEKKFYIDLVCSSITEDEQYVLFFYSLIEKKEYLIDKINKHGLLYLIPNFLEFRKDLTFEAYAHFDKNAYTTKKTL